MAEVGFPAGVVNIAAGTRAASPASTSPSIRRSARSRSPDRRRSGRKIVQASSGNLKKVQLELGGKGANIVFDDANLDAAVQRLRVRRSSTTRGRRASPASRLIAAREDRRRVPRTLHRAGALDPARQSARSDDRDGAAHVAAASRPRAVVCRCRARAGRATCCRAARRRSARRSRRAATSSRRSSRAKPTDRVAQEEVFGPFVTVHHVQQRRRGARDRQRHRVRPGRRPVDARTCSARTASRASAQRHGVDQLLQARESRLAVRRRRRERLWPRDGLRGDARVHAGQVGLGQRRRATSRLTTRAEAMEPFIYQGMPSRVVFGAGSSSTSSARSIGWARSARIVLSTPQQRDTGRGAGRNASGARVAGVFAKAVMHVPVETAREARDYARAARRRLRGGDRRRLDDGSRQGDRARPRRCRSSPCRPPTPAPR